MFLNQENHWRTTLSACSAWGILEGGAQAYDAYYCAALTELETAGAVCEIREVWSDSKQMNVIALDEEGGPMYWVNESLAAYFGHEKVLRIRTP